MIKYKAQIKVTRDASDYDVFRDAVELLQDASGYDWFQDGDIFTIEGKGNFWANFEDDLSYVTQRESNVSIYLEVDDGISDPVFFHAQRGAVEEIDYNPFEQ